MTLAKNPKFKSYKDSLHYSLYVITHPIDGFWDLTHEKRGSLAAANTIVLATLITRILSLQITSPLFNVIDWNKVNLLQYLASIILPLFLFCVGNWGLTTLFDGKGKLSQIYMAAGYAMTPYVLIQLPASIISNGLTLEGKAFYEFACGAAIFWAAVLLICAMMQIHEYTLSKTILFMIATAFAMLVMIFLMLLFFSMISQGIAYFVSLVKEIIFRM